jgi:pyrroline-5-carboxylate reductase
LASDEEEKMKKIGFIGAGNMAGALIKGLLNAKMCKARDLLVSDVLAVQRRKIKRVYNVESTTDNLLVMRQTQTIVLAVKPQIIDQVLAEIQPAVRKDQLFISVAAGIPLRRLEHGLGAHTRIIRVMPNTPALVGKGMAVIVRGHKAKPQDERIALQLFQGVGEALAVKNESLLDAVTGLSGSGPAYVYLFAEALITGGMRAGLSPTVATRLTFQTLAGSIAMLRETNMSPQELRAMVSSPGGTTLAGLSRLAEGQFAETVVAAISAATQRSQELGQE